MESRSRSRSKLGNRTLEERPEDDSPDESEEPQQRYALRTRKRKADETLQDASTSKSSASRPSKKASRRKTPSKPVKARKKKAPKEEAKHRYALRSKGPPRMTLTPPETAPEEKLESEQAEVATAVSGAGSDDNCPFEYAARHHPIPAFQTRAPARSNDPQFIDESESIPNFSQYPAGPDQPSQVGVLDITDVSPTPMKLPRATRTLSNSSSVPLDAPLKRTANRHSKTSDSLDVSRAVPTTSSEEPACFKRTVRHRPPSSFFQVSEVSQISMRSSDWQTIEESELTLTPDISQSTAGPSHRSHGSQVGIPDNTNMSPTSMELTCARTRTISSVSSTLTNGPSNARPDGPRRKSAYLLNETNDLGESLAAPSMCSEEPGPVKRAARHRPFSAFSKVSQVSARSSDWETINESELSPNCSQSTAELSRRQSCQSGVSDTTIVSPEVCHLNLSETHTSSCGSHYNSSRKHMLSCVSHFNSTGTHLSSCVSDLNLSKEQEWGQEMLNFSAADARYQAVHIESFSFSSQGLESTITPDFRSILRGSSISNGQQTPRGTVKKMVTFYETKHEDVDPVQKTRVPSPREKEAYRQHILRQGNWISNSSGALKKVVTRPTRDASQERRRWLTPYPKRVLPPNNGTPSNKTAFKLNSSLNSPRENTSNGPGSPRNKNHPVFSLKVPETSHMSETNVAAPTTPVREQIMSEPVAVENLGNLTYVVPRGRRPLEATYVITPFSAKIKQIGVGGMDADHHLCTWNSLAWSYGNTTEHIEKIQDSIESKHELAHTKTNRCHLSKMWPSVIYTQQLLIRSSGLASCSSFHSFGLSQPATASAPRPIRTNFLQNLSPKQT